MTQQILIVDDEPTTCRTIARLLRAEGYEATCAGDGAAALDVLRAAPPPHLVVLDLMMPCVSGWDVLREIRCRGAGGGGRVAVVVYSALADEGVRGRVLAAGADGYVIKAMGWEPLRAELAKHLPA